MHKKRSNSSKLEGDDDSDVNHHLSLKRVKKESEVKSEESFVDKTEALRALLVCPFCLDFIQPPILQCPNGHLFCEMCRRRFRSRICQTCREPLPSRDIHNKVVENLVEELGLSFPCQNNGCNQSMALSERADHMKNCEHRPFSCPVFITNTRRCDWLGTAEQLVGHLTHTHRIATRHLSDGGSLTDYLDLINDFIDDLTETYRVIEFKGQFFLYVLECIWSRGHSMYITATLQIISKYDATGKFRYDLKITGDSTNGDQSAAMTLLPKSLRLIRDVYTQNGMTFRVDPYMADTFSCEKKIRVSLTIRDNVK